MPETSKHLDGYQSRVTRYSVRERSNRGKTSKLLLGFFQDSSDVLEIENHRFTILSVLQQPGINLSVVLVVPHPLLDIISVGVDLAHPIHVPPDDVVTIQVPEGREILPVGGRPVSVRTLIRDRPVRVLEDAEPLLNAEVHRDGVLACDLLERLDGALESRHLAGDLKVLARDLGAVIKGIAGEEADVPDGDHGDMAFARRKDEDEGSISTTADGAKNRLSLFASILFASNLINTHQLEHIHVGACRDAAPGHVIVTDNGGLRLQPVADATLGIVMLCPILWIVPSFLQQVRQAPVQRAKKE